MEPFPQDWELISVFECEPDLSDRLYKRFDSRCGDDRIRCEMWPEEGDFNLQWWHADNLQIDLKLRWVAGLTIETLNGCDALNLMFREKHVLPLRFQINPFVSLTWGTSWEL